MHAHYARIDETCSVMKASEPPLSTGVPVLLVPPPNAKYYAPGDIGVQRPYYLHFTNGFFEHSDGKMRSILFPRGERFGLVAPNRWPACQRRQELDPVRSSVFLVLFGCVFERRSVSTAFSLG